MAGGAIRYPAKVAHDARKGPLTPDELGEAMRLRKMRMSWAGVARCLGRAAPDLRAWLDPTYSLE